MCHIQISCVLYGCEVVVMLMLMNLMREISEFSEFSWRI